MSGRLSDDGGGLARARLPDSSMPMTVACWNQEESTIPTTPPSPLEIDRPSPSQKGLKNIPCRPNHRSPSQSVRHCSAAGHRHCASSACRQQVQRVRSPNGTGSYQRCGEQEGCRLTDSGGVAPSQERSMYEECPAGLHASCCWDGSASPGWFGVLCGRAAGTRFV